MRSSTRVSDTRVNIPPRSKPGSGTLVADRAAPPVVRGGRPVSRRRLLARVRRDPAAKGALFLVVLLVVSSIVAPLLSPYTGAGNFDERLAAPSLAHPMGTDDFGRDVLLRLMTAGRVSLSVGCLAMLIALAIGMTAGAVSGYRGGFVDTAIMRTTDLVLAVPTFFIVLLLARVIDPGFVMICLLIAMTQWMEVARVVRSIVLSIKQHEFVEAARALGVSDRRILLRHIMTHTSGPVLVSATLGAAQAIMMESAISFLGFGVQPPSASWGSMLTDAQSNLGAAPWLAVFPGLMIFFTVLSCYALGDFLRTALAVERR